MSESPLEHWKEEMRAAYLYDVLTETEVGGKNGDLFSRLAKEARDQALIWATEVKKAGLALPHKYHPDFRARLIALLTRRFGGNRMREILAGNKVRGMAIYRNIDVSMEQPLHPLEMERRHRSAGTGRVLRASVFGVSDGLVSNASLIMGVAGASADPNVVALSGIAGLMAGAFSMAVGEYISVRSQREMFEYQIGLEREELNTYPEAETLELAAIYEAKGLTKDEAHRVAAKLISDPNKALDTLAREELGLNPDQLGSPWWAASSSFLSFSFGALVPLLPFFWFEGPALMKISMILTAVFLFVVGASLSLFTGRKMLWGAFRMLGLGAVAAGATFFIGRWLGVNLV